jgi:hypothetical protein
MTFKALNIDISSYGFNLTEVDPAAVIKSLRDLPHISFVSTDFKTAKQVHHHYRVNVTPPEKDGDFHDTEYAIKLLVNKVNAQGEEAELYLPEPIQEPSMIPSDRTNNRFYVQPPCVLDGLVDFINNGAYNHYANFTQSPLLSVNLSASLSGTRIAFRYLNATVVLSTDTEVEPNEQYGRSQLSRIHRYGYRTPGGEAPRGLKLSAAYNGHPISGVLQVSNGSNMIVNHDTVFDVEAICKEITNDLHDAFPWIEGSFTNLKAAD